MKTELTINHLKQYLGTGLKGYGTDGAIYELTGITEDYALFKNEKYSKVTGDIKDFKPILRPLSDLHKEIEHQGTKIIPFIELAKITFYYNFNLINENYEKMDRTDDRLIVDSYGAKWKVGTPDSVAPNEEVALIIYPSQTMFTGFTHDLHFQFRQYVHGGEFHHPVKQVISLINKLVEMHFDIYGLINIDLAVDINTVK